MVRHISEYWGNQLPLSTWRTRVEGRNWYVAVGVVQRESFAPELEGQVVVPIETLRDMTIEQIGQHVRALTEHARALYALAIAQDMLNYRERIFKKYREHNNDVIDVRDFILEYVDYPRYHENDREIITKALRMAKDFIAHVDRKETGKTTKRYERAAAAKDFDALFIAVGRRDGFKCAACGSVDGLQLDHIEPVALGGQTHPNNLQLLCKPCNLRKGERTIDYRGTLQAEENQ